MMMSAIIGDMTITVIGTGFVGVVSSAVFADFGNTVYGLDIDKDKVASLSKGKVPFFEPGLSELMNRSLSSGNLIFTTSYKQAIADSDVIMIAVGTPSQVNGQADLTYVKKAAESMAPHLKKGAIVAVKSTVPPGTLQLVKDTLKKFGARDFFTAALPEFLREGSAVNDTLHPDRVVIGAREPHVIEILTKLHQPLDAPTIVVAPESAQMSKYAANAYLALRITFINQIANLCEHNGADIEEVVRAMGQDKRIGSHYWYPGLGYGGSCFPKDVKELAAYARSIGQDDNLTVTIDALNEARIPKLMQHYQGLVKGWQGKKVAVLGLSFKPNTDDIREAPALKVIPLLTQAGASVVGYDPKAMPAFTKIMPEVTLASSAMEAISEADVVILLVEWPELVGLPLADVKQAMKGSIFIDTRNQYSLDAMKAANLTYIGVGRSV